MEGTNHVRLFYVDFLSQALINLQLCLYCEDVVGARSTIAECINLARTYPFLFFVM
jgi:hypothetical protein